MAEETPVVGSVMGSQSDWATMRHVGTTLAPRRPALFRPARSSPPPHPATAGLPWGILI